MAKGGRTKGGSDDDAKVDINVVPPSWSGSVATMKQRRRWTPRATARALLLAWLVPIVFALVRPTPCRVAIAGVAIVLHALGAIQWVRIASRNYAFVRSLEKRHADWLLAGTQLEAFEAAALTYAIASSASPLAEDPMVAVQRAGVGIGVFLSDAQCEAIRARALAHVDAVLAGVTNALPLGVLRGEVARVEAAHASAKVRLAMMEEEYRRRAADLERERTASRAEVEHELKRARARLAQLNQLGADALRYPESVQAPTSEIGVSVDAMRSAVDRGMADARGGRVAVQPTLLGASLSERARWSVHSNENLAMTRELLALFEPLSGQAPIDELERAEPPGIPPTEPPARK